MPVFDRLASRLGANGDLPNQELARELVASGDTAAIADIAGVLQSRDKPLQSDCIKVLYEIGYRKPELIAPYAGVFLGLLSDKNNRMVWGAMIALSTIAPLAVNTINENIALVYDAIMTGSVITVDNGVRVLAAVAAKDPAGSTSVIRYLFDHLKTCRPQEVPQHAESAMIAINAGIKGEFVSILQARETDMTPSQMKRIGKLYRSIGRIN